MKQDVPSSNSVNETFDKKSSDIDLLLEKLEALFILNNAIPKVSPQPLISYSFLPYAMW